MKEKAGIILICNIEEEIKVAIVQTRCQGNDKWGLPKGSKKKKEPIFECAKRELYEETGIKLDKIAYKQLGKRKIYNITFFICKVCESHDLNPIDKHEIKDAKWMSVKEIKSLNNTQINRTLRKKNKKKSNTLISSIINTYSKKFDLFNIYK